MKSGLKNTGLLMLIVVLMLVLFVAPVLGQQRQLLRPRADALSRPRADALPDLQKIIQELDAKCAKAGCPLPTREQILKESLWKFQQYNKTLDGKNPPLPKYVCNIRLGFIISDCADHWIVAAPQLAELVKTKAWKRLLEQNPEKNAQAMYEELKLMRTGNRQGKEIPVLLLNPKTEARQIEKCKQDVVKSYKIPLRWILSTAHTTSDRLKAAKLLFDVGLSFEEMEGYLGSRLAQVFLFFEKNPFAPDSLGVRFCQRFLELYPPESDWDKRYGPYGRHTAAFKLAQEFLTAARESRKDDLQFYLRRREDVRLSRIECLEREKGDAQAALRRFNSQRRIGPFVEDVPLALRKIDSQGATEMFLGFLHFPLDRPIYEIYGPGTAYFPPQELKWMKQKSSLAHKCIFYFAEKMPDTIGYWKRCPEKTLPNGTKVEASGGEWQKTYQKEKGFYYVYQPRYSSSFSSATAKVGRN